MTLTLISSTSSLSAMAFKFLRSQNIRTLCTKVSPEADKQSIISSIDTDDIQRHANLATQWWDRHGPMRALHSLNQIRVPFIRDGIIACGNVDKQLLGTSAVLKGVRMLEVGCGGGVLTENLARLHAQVTAIDPGEEVINIAKDHVRCNSELSPRIEYRNEAVELHAKEHQCMYDAVVISEVLEHVNDKTGFLGACIDTLKPGGSLFITTFNKTQLSWLGAIVVAEGCMGIVPKGTHDWNKFIPPIETQRILDSYNCSTILINGFLYNNISDTWYWIPSTQISYALQAVKMC